MDRIRSGNSFSLSSLVMRFTMSSVLTLFIPVASASRSKSGTNGRKKWYLHSLLYYAVDDGLEVTCLLQAHLQQCDQWLRIIPNAMVEDRHGGYG